MSECIVYRSETPYHDMSKNTGNGKKAFVPMFANPTNEIKVAQAFHAWHYDNKPLIPADGEVIVYDDLEANTSPRGELTFWNCGGSYGNVGAISGACGPKGQKLQASLAFPRFGSNSNQKHVQMVITEGCHLAFGYYDRVNKNPERALLVVTKVGKPQLNEKASEYGSAMYHHLEVVAVFDGAPASNDPIWKSARMKFKDDNGAPTDFQRFVEDMWTGMRTVYNTMHSYVVPWVRKMPNENRPGQDLASHMNPFGISADDKARIDNAGLELDIPGFEVATATDYQSMQALIEKNIGEYLEEKGKDLDADGKNNIVPRGQVISVITDAHLLDPSLTGFAVTSFLIVRYFTKRTRDTRSEPCGVSVIEEIHRFIWDGKSPITALNDPAKVIDPELVNRIVFGEKTTRFVMIFNYTGA